MEEWEKTVELCGEDEYGKRAGCNEDCHISQARTTGDIVYKAGQLATAKEIIAEIEMAHGIDIKSPNTTHIRISKMWWQSKRREWLGEK